MTALAAIHVAKKELGLDDAAYRDILVRVAGKRSAGDMTHAELQKVIEELRRLGFKPASKAAESTLAGPFGGKLQALWISGWHLGVVRDRKDAALLAFVEHQTGISHTRFLRGAGDARSAIEALKAWLAREGGVDWRTSSVPVAPGGAPRLLLANDPRYQVVMAQWRKLIALDAVSIGKDETRTLTATIGLETGKAGFAELTDNDWSTLMAALGRRIRIALGRKAKAA